MRRSASMSGASIVLDLLPKEISFSSAEMAPIKAVVPANLSGSQSGDAIAGAELVQGAIRAPLGPIAAQADLSLDYSRADSAALAAELAAGHCRQVLGQLLSGFVAEGKAQPWQIYSATLCLAMMARNGEAISLLALLDGQGLDHPAVLALRGYLAYQNRQEELGRKSLARAALLARSNPAHRSILHFTQQVLLAQQFGA